MSKYFFVIFAMLFCGNAHAQNLVPNNGFETISSCPTGQNQLSLAVPWHMPANTLGTSDLFHACNTTGFSVPVNPAGYQNAHNGSAYAGFYTFGASNTREYIQVQLTSPLIAGVQYEVEMYVSPSEYAGIAVDAIGMYISTGPVSGTGSFLPLPFLPQISNPANNIITDTLGWTVISGIYTATGGENYITIGNFNDDANTNTLIFNPSGWGRGYYFIDEISVTPYTSINEAGEADAFNIFPNPFSTVLYVASSQYEPTVIMLYDIASRKIIEKQFTNNVSLNTEHLSGGVYFYEIRNRNGSGKSGRIVKY